MTPTKHRHGAEEPFILLAITSLVIVSLWMWIRSSWLLEFFYSNNMLALAHTLTLGFVSSVIMGVLYRLVPMSLFVQPVSLTLGRIQFGLFLIGVTGMVAHFLRSEWANVAWSALFVWLAAMVQFYNWKGLITTAIKGDWVARYVMASMAYLVLAGTLGALMGFAKGLPQYVSFPHTSFVSNLYVHIHLAGLGWVTNMVFGFHLRLWPRTLGPRRYLWLRFWLLQTGIIGLVVTQWVFDSGQALFAAMIMFAVGWQAWNPARAFIKNRVREWELVPLVFLLLTALAGLGLSLGWPSAESSLRSKVQMAYGFVGLWGWFVLTINIFVYKLFPMWVWQERFGKDHGKVPVPAMKDLYSHALRTLSLLSYCSGIVLTVVAILISNAVLIKASLALVLVGTATFVTNFFRMARWQLFNLTYTPQAEE